MDLLIGYMLLSIMIPLLGVSIYCLFDSIKEVNKYKRQEYLGWSFVFSICTMLALFCILIITKYMIP